MGLSIFSITEVISFLKNNDYDKFNFKDELAIIYANDIEILFELCNGSISEELGEIAVSVLENLEKYRIAYSDIPSDTLFPMED